MTTSTDLLNEARGWIGTVEDPPGSNHCDITERFADLSGWEWCRSGNPWCDMTVSVWLTNVGIETTFAYCPSHVNWFKANGTWVGDGDADCQPGDVVFFDWDNDGIADHVGVVEQPGSPNVFTVEGNSGGPNGEGVWRHNRHRSLILGFGRPAYTDVPIVAPPTQEEAELTPVGRPVLRRGSTGEAVRTWQGLIGAGQDGDFGPDTEAKTKDFQAKAGIESDGVVGPDTWHAMDLLLTYIAAVNAAPPLPPASDVPEFPGRNLSEGMSGEDVRQFQEQMANRGWNIAADGSFGSRTATVVRQFQAEKGLDVDGVVGPDTWGAAWTAPL